MANSHLPGGQDVDRERGFVPVGERSPVPGDDGTVDGFVVAGVGTKVLCVEYHGGESGDEGENAGTNKSKAGDGEANDDGGLDAAAYSGYGWNIGRSIDVPVDAMNYSDFIKKGRWSEVDEALRGIYEEASEELGRKFEYPTE